MSVSLLGQDKTYTRDGCRIILVPYSRMKNTSSLKTWSLVRARWLMH